MRKERSHKMILSAASTTPAPQAAAGKRLALAPLLLLVLIAIVAVGTGVAFAESAAGPTHYACISISHQGSDEKVTTSGLLHYQNSNYYISCNEGSSLPTGKFSASCLTISPKTVAAAIGKGASTEYYYVSSTGGAITLQGAPTPVNATEFITPAGLSLTVAC